MRIGVIGGGSVGGTLGCAWARRGRDVMFGVRDPRKPKVQDLVARAGGVTRAGTVVEAAAHGEVVVLATPWTATYEALKNAGDLSGKILLDCTNPLKPDLTLEVGHTSSGAEQVAEWAPGARVVKIFNTTGFDNMANPRYGDQAATMFFAGDDGVAKSIAAELAGEIGFEPMDAGPLKNARLLEPLAVLWIYMAMVQGKGRSIAFKLLSR